MTEWEMHYINCIRRFIPFRNVGDKAVFNEFAENWIRERESQQTVRSENNNEAVNTDSIIIKPYFYCKHVKFEELTNIKLTLPIYQRAYVWDLHNCETLWNSINNKEQRKLNLGTIVLYNGSIVDGQQRLTTLAILHRLLTGDENSELYRRLFDENNRIKKNTEKYFREKIRELQESELKRILTSVKDIEFLVLEIDGTAPRMYQYTVFSCINGKGKKLTVQEKVKNFLLKKYKEQVKLDDVKLISETEGFVKAFAEYRNAAHIEEKDLYNEFKKLICKISLKDLTEDCKCFRYIKGMTRAKKPGFVKQMNTNLYKKFIINLKLYQQLKTNTADALILNFMRDDVNPEDINELLRRLNTLYFLLYTDDPNGNGKKSVNSKLPRLIKLQSPKIYSNSSINDQEIRIMVDDVFYESKNITEYIWDKILAANLANMKANITRFILMMLEIWMGMDVNTAFEILNTENGKRYNILDKSEIEHIFPANPGPDLNNVPSPGYLYSLENIFLLEGEINKSIKNKILTAAAQEGKNNVTKLGVYNKDTLEITDFTNKKYKDSKYLMPNMFYINENGIVKVNPDLVYLVDNKGYYNEEKARNRISMIKKIIDEKNLFRDDIKSVIKP